MSTATKTQTTPLEDSIIAHLMALFPDVPVVHAPAGVALNTPEALPTIRVRQIGKGEHDTEHGATVCKVQVVAYSDDTGSALDLLAGSEPARGRSGQALRPVVTEAGTFGDVGVEDFDPITLPGGVTAVGYVLDVRQAVTYAPLLDHVAPIGDQLRRLVTTPNGPLIESVRVTDRPECDGVQKVTVTAVRFSGRRGT